MVNRNDNKKLASNAMLAHYPQLIDEWDFKKNEKIGLDVYKVTRGTDKIAWWNCHTCKSKYDMAIRQRTISKQNCPFCAGLRINHTNSLFSLKPNLAKEWHPTKNGVMTPHDVSIGSSRKIWWLGKCGHEWDEFVYNRRRSGTGCPICSNHRVLKGFNDMWTTNPELAKLLADPEDGYKYTQFSGKKLNWKCSVCGNSVPNKAINNTSIRGLSCPTCSDEIPFGEKFVYKLLLENNIKFDYDRTKKWSQGKRYDFYLYDYNWIIEVHGKQHYEGLGFSSYDEGKTVREVIMNDIFKKNLAIDNRIDNYIILDARESSLEHLKASILNSDLMKLSLELDFIKLGEYANKTFVKEVCELWNSGIHSPSIIAEMTNIERGTIRKYLKRGREIGWCNYSIETSLKQRAKGNQKAVIQLTLDFEFLREWESVKEAYTSLNMNRGSIAATCRGVQKTAGGFRWMYKDDYVHYNKQKAIS